MQKSLSLTTSSRKSKIRDRQWEAITGLLFILPALVLFVLFGLYPFLRTVQISFNEWDGISSSMRFIGLENYLLAFKDRIWWLALRNGALLSLAALIVMDGLGLLLAWLVDRGVRGSGFYRAVFYVPTILSGVVVAIIWKWIYQPAGGPLNQVLTNIGLGSWAHAWLGDTSTALWAVSICSMWQGVGSPFLLFLAGLQGVPLELYEAARLDGASEFQVFRYVTLPFLVPVTALISVLTILGAMQLFNIVMALTNGGPGYATEVPVLHIYREAFDSMDFGYATALSMIFGAILFAISMLQMWLSRRVGVRA
jgi:raffinose/stachyose/melibiose transport system permease protein